MEHNYQRELSVEELADVCKLNRSYFSKLFKDSIGCPPQEFLIRLRLAKARQSRKTSDRVSGLFLRGNGPAPSGRYAGAVWNIGGFIISELKAQK